MKKALRHRGGLIDSLPRYSKLLLVFAVLVSFFAIQTASVFDSFSHHEDGPNHHCCPGCHAGHTPILQAALAHKFVALAESGWRPETDNTTSVLSGSRAFHSSRAPPVFSLFR